MQLQLIQSIEAVHAIQGAWRALLTKSICHPAFSSPDWFLAYLKAFEAAKPWVFVAIAQGEIIGIAPLYRDNSSGQLHFADALADYQDIIVAHGDDDTAVRLLKQILTQNGGLLAGIRSSSNIHSASKSVSYCPEITDILGTNSKVHRCYYSDLSQGYQTFLATRSANFRFNLRKAQRRAIERGLEVCELSTVTISGQEVVEHFLDLHQQRFPQKLFSQPQAQMFCRLALPNLFKSGTLKAFALIEAGRIVGIHLSVCDINRLGVWNGGFDTKLTSVSPGKLLINKQIEVCCELGFQEFDFLRGDEAYKQSWSSAYRNTGVLYF